MGRWGFRMFLEKIPPRMGITDIFDEPLGLFQGDLDLDTCADVETMVVNFLSNEEVGPQILITPAMRETGQKIIDSAEEQKNGGSGGSYLLDNIKRGDPAIREILDHAVCFTLLDLSKGDEFAEIIIGALMMQAGAKLRPKDKRRLRKILAAFPEGDDELPENGFSNAGQAQFSAALDNYRAGTPRDFQCPSCDNCGKIEADIGTELLTCERCLVSFWCNEECKAANAAKHLEHGPCVNNAGN